MKKQHFALCSLAFLVAPITMTGCNNRNSKIVINRDANFNNEWKYLDNEIGAEDFVDVHVPHDSSINKPFDVKWEAESGFLPGGHGVYKKKFTLPSVKNASIILTFDGVYQTAKVKINGHYLGENLYGYNPFSFDIAPYVTCDNHTQNELTVEVDNPIPNSRWYSGTGIFRDVTLSVVNKLHVALDGTYITTPKIRDGNGEVKIDVDIENKYSTEQNISILNTIYDNENNEVIKGEYVNANVEANFIRTVSNTLKVNNPKLWSDKDPYLYRVNTKVYRANTLLDEYNTRFGFRHFEFNRRGFFINGVSTKLHGVCLHHDHGALGSASYNDAIYRQLVKMKEMGMNAIRTSHNIPDRDLLRMCDELGLFVVDESFDGWSTAKDDGHHDVSEIWRKHLTNQDEMIYGSANITWPEFIVKSMVRRDRNCPSIIMWSLGNELHSETSKIDCIFDASNLVNWVKEIDYDVNTQRPTTLGNDNRTTTSREIEDLSPQDCAALTIYDKGGLIAYNYGSDGQLQLGLKDLNYLYGSESSSAVISRGVYSYAGEGHIKYESSNSYEDPMHDGQYHLTSYDNSWVPWGQSAHEALYRVLNYDGFAGHFIWTGFDYIGEPTPWNGNSGSMVGGPAFPNSSYFGIMDTAGFNKDTYYLYRAHLVNTDTTLHLVGSLHDTNMHIDDTNDMTRVDIYTNAPKTIIKLGDDEIATITRNETTSQLYDEDTGDFVDGEHPYHTFTTSVTSGKEDICKWNQVGSDNEKGFNLFTSLSIKPEANKDITAEAYDENNNLISNTVGLNRLTHVGVANKINAYVEDNKTQIKADGDSLAYVIVDVLDQNNNLVIDSKNELCPQIDCVLEGEGNILGVDNGNEATTQKFQNIDALPNSKTAHIKTFGGKALIILGSTTKKGKMTLTIKCPTLGDTTTKTIEINTI